MTSNRVHKLSNGLYVSGAPDKYKDRAPTMTSTAMPYTGGDIKKSGELGKMFDIPVQAPRLKKSGPMYGGAPAAGTFRANSGPLNNNGVPVTRNSGPQGLPQGGYTRPVSHSGPLYRNGDPANVKSGMSGNPNTSHNLKKSGSLSSIANQNANHNYNLKKSGSLPSVTNLNTNYNYNLKKSGSLSSGTNTPGMVRQNSGPLAPNLPTTGLITSGPITSGPLPGSRKHSGPLDSNASSVKRKSSINNQAINNLSHFENYSFKRTFPRVILWTVIPLFVIGLVAGGFILGAVQNAILLIVVVCLLCAILILLMWNTCVGKGAVTGFIASFPSVNLSQAKDGQYVKVTGVVTCGNVPLETSYQRVSRCVYTSSGLFEYRGFKSTPAGPHHWTFSWGLRHLERYATDFYISDLQSGLRALVKAGYSATVTPYVEESTVVDVSGTSGDISPPFLRWLADRNLSSNDRKMRLKEGYIREGFTVTIMGVVQRNENVLMIVPPSEPVSTGCQWGRFLMPATMEGLVLRCEDTTKADVIPV